MKNKICVTLLAASSSITCWGQIQIPAPSRAQLPGLDADVAVVTQLRTPTGAHTQVESGHFWRSSNGSTRQDTATGSLISDGTNGTLIHLSHTDMTARSTHREHPAFQQSIASEPPQSTVQTAHNRRRADPRIEDLGEATFDGWNARGERMTIQNPPGMYLGTIIIETWFAPDLGLNIYYKQTGPAGETEQRYENIRVGEPDPSVFEIPESYARSERPGQSVSPNPSTRTK